MARVDRLLGSAWAFYVLMLGVLIVIVNGVAWLDGSARGVVELETGEDVDMSAQSRRLAGILLVLVPLAVFGGASLLSLILTDSPGYLDNPVRQDLWRAGHAHAGVLLILSLVLLRYVDEADLSGAWLWLARGGVPLAAILMPTAFFLSVLSPDASQPGPIIYLAYVGALLVASAVLTLGVGLLRASRGK